jgi:DNA-binding PadR family transcriptional regulator
MREGSGVQFAILGVVSRYDRGVHGYALKRQCDRILGTFWQLNFGKIYRVLDRLAAEGLIEQVLSDQDSSRKSYRITDKGKQTLDDFVGTPPTDAPRPLRQELAVKLLFADGEHLPELLRVVDYQRNAYLRQLSLLGSQRRKLRRIPVDAFVTNLLIDGAELAVRAELGWLDDVGQKLKDRFPPPAR